MKWIRVSFALCGYFCLATVLAEAGMLAVLWARGQVNAVTLQHLQVIALEVPVREIHDRLEARSQPAKHEMLSFAEVQDARMLTSLDLDLREMSSDKGLIDLHDLDLVFEQEVLRYAELKDDFDQRWQSFEAQTTDSELKEVARKISSVSPELAKDQLLRILDDQNLDPETAFNHVVAIFRGLPIEKRKKIVVQFDGADVANLHEILRRIRLGMPQLRWIQETREKLQQLNSR